LSDIAERMAVNLDYASQYRARLLAAEVITPAGRGKVTFAVPFLREHLRQTA